MYFTNFFVLGMTKVAKMCQKIAQKFFHHEVCLLSYNQFNDEFFKNIKNSLIISANNFYIFKKRMYKKQYHYKLS